MPLYERIPGLRTDTATTKFMKLWGQIIQLREARQNQRFSTLIPARSSDKVLEDKRCKWSFWENVAERYETPCFPGEMVNGDSGGASGQCNVSAVRDNPK